jgi:hypothetical protein
MNTIIHCPCGAIEMLLSGEPMAQFYCHCDDCQQVHGKAYPSSLYPASAVIVRIGATETLTLKTTPRTKCKRCGTYLFAEVPGYGVRGVNSELLTVGMFHPAFHVQCRYVAASIQDDLPHYKDNPARFYGSDELMQWQQTLCSLFGDFTLAVRLLRAVPSRVGRL